LLLFFFNCFYFFIAFISSNTKFTILLQSLTFQSRGSSDNYDHHLLRHRYLYLLRRPYLLCQLAWELPEPLQVPVASYLKLRMPTPVIDLTGSSPLASAGPSRQPAPARPRSTANLRPNRAASEVIDVDALPDTPTPPERAPFPNGGEDDIELLFTRPGAPRPPPRGRFQGREPPPPPPPPPQPPVEPAHAFLGFNPGPRFGPQEDPILGHGGRIGQHVMGLNGAFHNQPMRRGWIQAPQPGPQFRMPNMDYSVQAPGIMRRNTPPVDAAAIRNADYMPPPPARNGFTRSPRESDVLLCAQCDQELSAETEETPSEQVWAGKCGHVGFQRLSDWISY
jgi:hypothetical protein